MSGDQHAAPNGPAAGQEQPEAREEDTGALSVVGTLASSLWFPLLFFFGFLVCYLLPFHAPRPHDVRVSVAGPAQARQVSTALEGTAPGAFDIRPVVDAAAARRAVLDRDSVAGYVPAPGAAAPGVAVPSVPAPGAASGGTATLYLAKADGSLLEQTVTSTFTAVAGAAGQQLHTVELVPTAHGDVTGTGLFYLGMAWNIAPYIAVMMLIRAVGLDRRGKLLTLVALGVFLSVVGYLVARAVDVVPAQPLALLYGFLITQVVAWTTYGLVPFVRQFIPGVAITLFVLLSIPSSGGAVPWQMVPWFFRALHPVMPLGNLIEALHGVLYFDGRGVARPTAVLCAWLLVGVSLVAVGAWLQHRRELAQASEALERAQDQVDERIERAVEDPAVEAPTPHPLAPASHTERPQLVGTVRHTDGTPVPHQLVTVLGRGGRQLMHTHTDHEGRYAASGLPEDFAAVLLLARGHTPAVARVLPRAGHTLRQDFVLVEARGDRPRHAAPDS